MYKYLKACKEFDLSQNQSAFALKSQVIKEK